MWAKNRRPDCFEQSLVKRPAWLYALEHSLDAEEEFHLWPKCGRQLHPLSRAQGSADSAKQVGVSAPVVVEVERVVQPVDHNLEELEL